MLTCFRCREEIKSPKLYVLIGDSYNSYFCVPCRDKEIYEMTQLDPEVAPLWAKNFTEKTNPHE